MHVYIWFFFFFWSHDELCWIIDTYWLILFVNLWMQGRKSLWRIYRVLYESLFFGSSLLCFLNGCMFGCGENRAKEMENF